MGGGDKDDKKYSQKHDRTRGNIYERSKYEDFGKKLKRNPRLDNRLFKKYPMSHNTYFTTCKG